MNIILLIYNEYYNNNTLLINIIIYLKYVIRVTSTLFYKNLTRGVVTIFLKEKKHISA